MTHLISTTLDGTEDSFFILRDCRQLLQRRLTEIIRLAGISSLPVIEAYAEALGAAHDELAAARQRDGFEQSHGLTASRITLMCDADLELEIRIGEISRRLADIGGNALWRAQLRYMTLLHRPEMAQADNPAGPEAICEGLWAICHTSDAGLEGNFTLLDRIEEQFVQQLPAFYGELNDLLASHRIEPAATQIAATSSTRAAATAQSTAGVDGKPNALSALQNMLNQQLGGSGELTPGHGDAASGNIAVNAAALVMLSQLAARLDQLESSGGGNRLPDGLAGVDQNAPPRPVRASDLDMPLGKPEAIALDTLAHIFEAIFAIWELPDTIKTAIGRLQIPLLKLAIFDPSLFSDTSHPARRLIDKMARAALGLPRDINRAHPVSARLWQLAGTVCETLQGDPSVLAAPLAELDALIAERDDASRRAAQSYLPLLRQQDARVQAALAARRWLQAIEQEGAPPEILDFLRRFWLRVMESASIADHDGGNLWLEYKTTIVDLLWSVQAKQSPDDRKRLAGLVPSLLKRISGGLDRIGTPAEERTAFLDICFNLQTAALRGNPSPPVRATADPATDTPAQTGIVLDVLEADGRLLKTLTVAGRSSGYRSPANGVQVGNWLQILINDREQLCGLLCWIDAKTGQALLFNPDWGYALAPGVLDQQLRDARAKVVSAQSIFDMAAERALKQLAGTHPAKGV